MHNLYGESLSILGCFIQGLTVVSHPDISVPYFLCWCRDTPCSHFMWHSVRYLSEDLTLLWYRWRVLSEIHYIDVIMTKMTFQITSPTVVYSAVFSDADQRKHQHSASLAFVWGIHRGRWIPRTKGQLRGKCFHLMTSSCNNERKSRAHAGIMASADFPHHWPLQARFFRLTIKNTSKLLITGRFLYEAIENQWISLTNGQLCGNRVHAMTPAVA